MRASDDDACEPQRLPSEVAEGMVLTVRVEVSLVCLVDIILTVPSGDEVSQTRGCFDQRRFDQKRLAPCQSAGAKTARSMDCDADSDTREEGEGRRGREWGRGGGEEEGREGGREGGRET